MKSFVEERQRLQADKRAEKLPTKADSNQGKEKPKSTELSVLVDSVNKSLLLSQNQKKTTYPCVSGFQVKRKAAASSFSGKGKRQKLETGGE
jgi:hypothetical protein